LPSSDAEALRAHFASRHGYCRRKSSEIYDDERA
jgi:hypothetical protein